MDNKSMTTKEQMREQERSEGYRDNNEAILNKLIHLGYVRECEGRIYYFTEKSLLRYKSTYDPISYDEDYLVLQRALFDECAKKGYGIEIIHRELVVFERRNFTSNPFQFKGDTSRESFVQAFCKVVGI